MLKALSLLRIGQVMLILLLFAVLAKAQVSTGTSTGLVTDPTGAAIPKAKVTVADLSTGQEHSVTTNTSGEFTVTNLPNGFYRVTIEAAGFRKFVVDRVQVNVGQTAEVFAQMELGKIGSEVVVEAVQSPVETVSPELKYSIDRQQIMNLPLPTRNPLDLVRALPGIVTPTSSGIADSFVHGLRGNSTNITQDGINVADNFVKTSAFFAISAPTVDTTGEFAVSIGGIGVDAGFGAGQVTIKTQRGSNDFHGSLFWFQRTRALNANTWFNNASNVPRPFQLQNRIGASAGGPVYIPHVYDGRNRSWVFGTYEAYREPLARSRTRLVLTPAARQGLFTYTPTSGGGPRQVNLLALGTIGSTGATPTVNTDVMNFYNSLVPDANTDQGCTGDGVNFRCFTFNLPGKNSQNRYTLRADHQLTQNHAIEFVFNQADFSSIPDLLNGIEPFFPKSTGGGQISRRQVFTWALHSSFGTNKTNEARFGFQRAPVAFDLFEKYADTGGFQLLPPRVTAPTITSTNLPQGRNTPVRQIIDNLAWVRGNHTFRFGGEYRQVLANSFFFNTVVPRVSLGSNSANPNGITAGKFTGGISSGDLGRASDIFNIVAGLLGSTRQGFNHTSPTSGFVKGVPRTIDPIQHNWSGYFEDSWKMRRNFTAQYGVRYEYQGVFDLRNGLILQPQDGFTGLWGPAGINNLFNPRSTPVLTDTLLNFAGSRNGKPLHQRDINNFAPFLGFAWDPRSDGKSSVRGSFAVHYTQDGFTLFQLSSTGNNGLFSVLTNGTATGVFSKTSNPTPSVPTASFPVSQRANAIATDTNADLWFFRPDLKTPYVLEWSLSLQRELPKRVTVEARYVGNHAVKLFRSWDLNEIDFLNNGLLTEFLNAKKNLAIGGNRFDNQGKPGQVPLSIFEKLFAGLAPGSGFANSGFITNLNQNEIGSMFDNIRRSNTYRTNREANFPLNFFVANPFASGAIVVDNSSWSYYHGLEFEVRRRFSGGLFLQANYTFSKVLADQRFLTSQSEFQAYRSLRNVGLDKNRAPFDITQSFAANFIYPLPFGKGHWLGRNANSALDKLIGGWSLQGFTRWTTGAPFNISSGRATTGSLVTQTPVLRNMTAKQFQNFIGTFRNPGGVFWLNPNSGLVTISDTTSKAVLCTPGQTTPCFDFPGPNEEGNLPFVGPNAPRFFDQDMSIIKRTPVHKISETFNVEIRFEFFNAFNTPNFTGLSNNINDNNFGQLTSSVDTVRGGGVTSRIIQWALRINW